MVRKSSRLLIIEANSSSDSLLIQYESLFTSVFQEPVQVQTISALTNSNLAAPQLILLHANLITLKHLRQFVNIQTLFPFSTIIVVSDEQDEELCILTLEAGAEDVISKEQLTKTYLYKASLVSQRRYEMHNELHQSKAQLMACIQNTPNVGVQWYNSKGEVLFWNNASENIFGWTAEEAVGKTIGQLMVAPEEEVIFVDSMKELTHIGASIAPEEYTYRRRDGSEGCCIYTLFRIDPVNEEPRYVCMDVDISDRKLAEQALLQSEQKYRLLVEQQADAITIFDEHGKLSDVNSSATQLLQYSHQELRQMNIMDVLDREDVKSDPVNFELLKQGHTTIKQRRMRRKDGSFVTTEVHTKQLDENLFLASARDLTERLEVQNRLEKEIALSDSIINSLPGLFYLFTSEGKYLRWNKQLQSISGYSEAEISSKTPYHFFPENEKAAIAAAIEKVYEDGHYAVEANFLTKHGKMIPYYFTGVTVDYAGTQCLLGMGIDLSNVKTLEKKLTQQKIAEQKKLMQAMIDAEEKEKNKLGLELHDNVNQILSVVRMYLTILNSDNKMEEITLSKTIQLLNNAIDEIRHLSHSLAVTYKFEAGLVEALDDMIEKVSAARDFSISLNTCERLDECTNNQQKLAIYRIVQEQLSNIIKYAKATEVCIDVETCSKAIKLTIVDNGHGFHPQNINKGLGLSNITNRAESLEGKACIQSAPGEGCSLTVIIPIQETEAVLN